MELYYYIEYVTCMQIIIAVFNERVSYYNNSLGWLVAF